MHGLVNQGIHDLAVELGGEMLWDQIRAAAGVEEGTLIGLKVYPDEVTDRLVQGASSVLGLPVDEVLQAFGRHWILYTARQGYGPLFDTMGRSLPEFLANLDAMHARLSLSMPDLRPPSFVCEQMNGAQIRLEYWSDRPGLAPMVTGLLLGLGELFDLNLTITQSVSRVCGADHDEFLVAHTPKRSAGGRDAGEHESAGDLRVQSGTHNG